MQGRGLFPTALKCTAAAPARRCAVITPQSQAPDAPVFIRGALALDPIPTYATPQLDSMI